MKTWAEVSESPDFAALSADEQANAREQYFLDVVAPRVPRGDLAIARRQFDAQTYIRKRELPAGVEPSLGAGGGRGGQGGPDPATMPAMDRLRNGMQGRPVDPIGMSARPMGAGLADAMVAGKPPAAAPQAAPPADPPQTAADMLNVGVDAGAKPALPGSSVLDQPDPNYKVNFAKDSSQMRGAAPEAQRIIKDRAAQAKIGPASRDQSLAFDVAESTQNPVARGAMAGVAGLGKIGVGATRLVADMVGAERASQFAAGAAGAASAAERGAAEGLGGNEKLVADVTGSIINSLPSVALGMVGGPALRTLFAQSTLAEYNAGRDAGFDPDESLGRGIIMGSAEALGERFGFGEQIKLLKSVTKGLPQGELAKVFGSMIAKEVPGEQLTTAMQFMADKIGPAALSPNAGFDEYLNAAAETLKVTIGQTLVMGGGPAAVNTARNTAAGVDRITQAPESKVAAEINSRFFAPPTDKPAPPTQARAESVKRFDELAAAFGLSEKAAQAVRQQAGTMPADDVPGFLARATTALNKRGLFVKPVDDDGIAALSTRLMPEQPKDAVPAADLVDDTGLDTPPAEVAGEQINKNWTAFTPESGTLNLPRDQVPQIKAEHRGALVNFLNARGIQHEQAEIPANQLKPTQGEFSPQKVKQAQEYEGGERSILVSQDGYILDGHHQWMARREAGEKVKAIVLKAPIQDLLRLGHQFPSSYVKSGANKIGTSIEARPAGTRGTNATDVLKGANVNQPDVAKPSGMAAGAGDAGAPVAGGSGGTVGLQPDGDAGVQPAAAAPVPSSGEAVPAGNGSQPDAALIPAEGTKLTLDGKPYTVKAAGKRYVTIAGADGKERVISDGSHVWPKLRAALGDAKKAPTAAYAATLPDSKPAEEVNAAPKEPQPAPDGQPAEGTVGAAPTKPKVYKTKDGATKARIELGNTHKVQKVKGGFILREKTDKELAAEAKNGRRLGGGSVDVERDSLLTAIAKLGGLSMKERPDTVGQGNKNVGGKMLFTRTGANLDEIANGALTEYGYIPSGYRDNPTTWLRDAIRNEFMGNNTYYSEQGTEWMEERQRQYEEANAIPEDPFEDFSVDDLEDAGYTQASPEAQALTEQLIAEAESLGIDTEGIREDIAQRTIDEAPDVYHAAVQEAIRSAVAKARADAAGGNASAAQGSGQDRGEPAGQEGAEEGLKRRAPKPFEPRSRDFEHAGKTYRITVDRYWKIDTVQERYDPDLLAWTATVQRKDRGASWFESIDGDKVPKAVAVKANAFFENVREVDAGESLIDQEREDQGEAQGLTLEAQTAEDLRAKTEREEAATKAAAAKKAAEQERLRKEAEARDLKARADATVADFQLGQDANAQMSGMGDMFADAPATNAETPAQPPSAPQQEQVVSAPARTPEVATQIELRKQLAVLKALRECIAS